MDNIQLFEDDSNTVQMPSIPQVVSKEEANNIEVKGITDKDLSGDEVSVVRVPTANVENKNYVIDLSQHDSITEFQARALSSLRSKNGDVTIYLKTSKAMVSIGKGESNFLSRILPLMMSHVLTEPVVIYKDFVAGAEPHVVERKDVTQMRLNL